MHRNIVTTSVRLKPFNRPSIAGHLKRLNPDDCYLRFGSVKTEEQIDEYVAKLNFNRDIIEGAFDGAVLVGMCNISVFDDEGYPGGELGITVDKEFRKQGIGANLVERTLAQAGARGVSRVHVHYMRRNLSMARLVAGKAVALDFDGDEATAILAPAQREKQHPIRRSMTEDKLEIYECDPVTAQEKGHVLFIHGAGGDSWMWRENLMGRLAQQGIGSAAISLRNHGDSVTNWDGSIDMMHADVARFIKEYGKPHSVLAGHSLGGYLVQHHLAEHSPERRAVLVNSVPSRALRGSDLDQAAEGLECHVARGVLRSAMANAPEVDLSKVKSPLLWIAGVRDRVIPKSWVRASVRAGQPAHDGYHELPGGHTPMLGRSYGLLSDQVERHTNF